MNTKRNYITEFIGLDLLRFLLSIMVVIRHYYHFYVPFPDSPFTAHDVMITEQPFYNLLGPIYSHGQYAVQVFWLISGLIFYSVYHQDIVEQRINFGKFSFLRFSRLYPLHLVTLIVALIAQFWFFETHNTFFVYQANDIRHFFLQLFLMGSWFPSMEHSFNVPVWSVSVEIFVYIFFFLITAAAQTRGNRLILIICITLIFNFYGFIPPFNACLLYFFSGCFLGKMIHDKISLRTLLVRYAIVSVVVVLGVWSLRSLMTKEQIASNADFVLTLRMIPIASTLVLISLIAFKNVTAKWLISFFRHIGNMTYSVYLVHFPIQIIIFMVLSPTDWRVFNNPIVLLSFVTISMAVGWLAYEYFEKPAQKWLRAKYLEIAGDDNVFPDQLAHNPVNENESVGLRLLRKGLNSIR
ncbi:MAG TPA: acyltransferase [Chryseolinea sp.]|nr:acyltransferase [Chryseolinea sp.]